MLAKPQACSHAGTVAMAMEKAVGAALEPRGETEASRASACPGSEGLEGRMGGVSLHMSSSGHCVSPHGHHQTWTGVSRSQVSGLIRVGGLYRLSLSVEQLADRAMETSSNV